MLRCIEQLINSLEAIANETDPVRQTLYRANEAVVELRLNEALNLITAYLSDRPNDYSAILYTQPGAEQVYELVPS